MDNPQVAVTEPVPDDNYDMYESAWPIVFQGSLVGQTPVAPGSSIASYPVVGFTETQVVFALPDHRASYTSDEMYTEVLEPLGVTNAVYEDGGPSAQLFGSALYLLKTRVRQFPNLYEPGPADNVPENNFTAWGEKCEVGHSQPTDCDVAYAVGLVHLGSNQIQTPGFEQPNILDKKDNPSCAGGGVNTGYQQFVWTTPDAQHCSNHWVGNTFLRALPGAARNQQVAAIGNRLPSGADCGNCLRQTITVPGNTYCQLHFWHGFLKANTRGVACTDPTSVLTVTVFPTGASTALLATSNEAAPSSALLQGWLRFRTPPSGTVDVKFEAKGSNENCEVLLDDVSVRCTRD
jgi:hypothetical protein